MPAAFKGLCVNRRALVLGAAGFVGRHTARSLAAAGYEVVGLGHGTWSVEEQAAWGLSEWRATDIDMTALLTYGGEPDVIVQCAGSGSVAFSMTHPVQDYRRNVDTTLETLEFLRLHAPQCRLVLPSSAAVYGAVKQMPIGIDTPLNPSSPYGVHKRMGEDLCRSYARHYDLPVAIVRLFSIYGPGLRKQLLWDACRKIVTGEPVFGGTGEERRDWLHVDDAAALLVGAAAQASSACPIVNGGTGMAMPNRFIVETLAKALGQTATPAFSGTARAGDPDHYEADIAQARAWGWAPAHAIEDGLTRYAEWFLSLDRSGHPAR